MCISIQRHSRPGVKFLIYRGFCGSGIELEGTVLAVSLKVVYI